MTKFFALIPAAGSGSRMGDGLPKQYLPLAGKPMIHHALQTLCRAPRIARVFVVLAPGDGEWPQHDWSEFSDKLVVLNCGGATRAASVLNGLKTLRAARASSISDDDWVLVHDAARPCLSAAQLDKLMDELADDAVGGLLAVPVADTLKHSDAKGQVDRTESREGLWQAQTPQMFRYKLLVDALSKASNVPVTDDAGAVEAMGLHPRLVLSDVHNLKVTYPQDLALAELILRASTMTVNKIRVGQGFDVHQLVEGRKLIIGGVTIPYAKGLLGHSDADVLLHAICDALLGAAALGDIGRHFSDTDPRYKNIDSRVLLREVCRLLDENGYRVVNIDATIIAEAPKMASHIPAMIANIAQDLKLPTGDVNVKAKTAEQLGLVGRGEGIVAEAVCSIVRKNDAVR